MSDDMPDYLKENLFDYKQRSQTEAYRDGWDRIFGKNNEDSTKKKSKKKKETDK